MTAVVYEKSMLVQTMRYLKTYPDIAILIIIGIINLFFAGSLLSQCILLSLAFVQNVSFTLVSRARNRNNFNFHLIAAIFSNGVWFATFKYLVIDKGMTVSMFIPYTVGTVLGSLSGSVISMYIEKLLGATSDVIDKTTIKLKFSDDGRIHVYDYEKNKVGILKLE
jgi:hypothetical protein